ncbi:MAG: mechanosensitive ion channel protein, partial [Mesorhizobium amorphae]
MLPLTLLRALTALLLWLAAMPALAQDAAAPEPPALVTEQQAALDQLSTRADSLQKAVEQASGDDSRLVDIRLEVEGLARSVLESGVAFRPRLDEINARLGEIGQPPGDNQPPEADVVTAERTALNAEKASINAVLGQAEQLSIRIGDEVDRITELRRNLFANQLTKRYVLDYELAGEFIRGFAAEAAGTWRSVASWLSFVARFKLQSALIACFLALSAAGLLLIVGRRLFARIFQSDFDREDPSPLSRLSVAFWSTLLPTAALWLFLGISWGLFDFFQVLRGDIGRMLQALFGVIAIVYFVHRLGMMALAPRRPQWRLLPVRSSAAYVLVAIVSTMALFTGVDFFLSTVFTLRASPVTLSVGESLIATVATGLLLLATVFVRPFADADGRPKHWPNWVRLLILAACALMILPALFGYIGFARFISRQVVITGAILATMGIGFLSARAVSEEGALAATKLGARLQRRFNLSDAKLDQLALMFSLVINLVVIAVGVPLILFQWGFQPGDIRAWLSSAAAGFTIGSFRFSPVGILSGLLIFALGYALTRWFQRWLDGSVMARGRVDAGVRNSINLVVGYAGYALAGLIAISAAGIDLSSLALVAGALSLGIGFGLQNIVSNFVSGLILLAERPFKVGDWIVAGAVTGTVKRISVRATEIETFQRQTVILPNSDLINSAVGNWTHRNKLGRLDIKVNVAYGMDARRAHDLLLEIARANPQVLRNPEPQAILLNFGAAALEMEL